MADLRMLPDALVRHGDVVTPPVQAVARRARVLRARRAGTTLIAAVLLVVLVPSVVQWVTDGDESSHVRLVDRTTTTTTMAVSMAAGLPPSADITEAALLGIELPMPAPTPPGRELECRARANGGATDLGVTADSISIVMTETMEFPTRYATAEAYAGVRALFDYVNRKGGICGRRLELRYANDAWRPLPWDAGADMLAAVAGPFDESVDRHIVDGSIDRAGVPIISADGLTATQHHSAWVWPLGASMESVTRIGVDYAYRSLDARTFALVYDDTELAGRQAEAALRDYVGQLPGARLGPVLAFDGDDRSPLDTLGPLDPFGSRPVYATKAAEFANRCQLQDCDYVLLALTPAVAEKWLAGQPVVHGGVRTAVLPVALTPAFWEKCPSTTPVRRNPACRGFHVWTADPEPASSLPCHGPNVDPLFNALRLSACILVEAIRQVGPDLTRARLRLAIDDLTYRTGLVAPFERNRRAPSERAGIGVARALTPVYSTLGRDLDRFKVRPDPSGLQDLVEGGEFERLADAGTGRIPDPLAGRSSSSRPQ